MGMPFLFARPKFICTKIIDGQEVKVTCSEEDACDSTQQQSPFADNRNYLANEFNLYCEKKVLLGILGSLFFVGMINIYTYSFFRYCLFIISLFIS